MSDSIPSNSMVSIYLGLGTQRASIWSGELQLLPRQGEYVVIDGSSHMVDRINHVLPHGKRKREVEIYVR